VGDSRGGQINNPPGPKRWRDPGKKAFRTLKRCQSEGTQIRKGGVNRFRKKVMGRQ